MDDRQLPQQAQAWAPDPELLLVHPMLSDLVDGKQKGLLPVPIGIVHQPSGAPHTRLNRIADLGLGRVSRKLVVLSARTTIPAIDLTCQKAVTSLRQVRNLVFLDYLLASAAV